MTLSVISKGNILHPDKVGHLLPSAVIILGLLAMYSIITKDFTSKKHSNTSDLVSIVKLTNKTSIKTLKYKKLKNLKEIFFVTQNINWIDNL